MSDHLFRFNIGRFACLAVRDGDDWDRNVLFVDTNQHRVLIDTGFGDATSPPGLLVDRLRAAGVTSDSIDVIILSHADCDHVGGAVDKHGNLTFPNARYVLAREEWSFWTSNAPRYPAHAHTRAILGEELHHLAETVTYERLPHLRDHITLVEFDTEIVPGVRVIGAPGHTPGMLATAITSADAQFLFIADIYYGWDTNPDSSEDPMLIGDPVWHAAVDLDPVLAVESRDRVLAWAARERIPLMASHVHFPGLGHVARSEAGWRWMPRQEL